MQKEFIPYELALELKELGFNEPCCANMFDYSKPHINTDIHNRIRYFMPNYSEDFNKEYDFGVVGHKDIYVSIPLYQQAFRWFREKYDLYHSIGLDNSLENDVNCDYQIINHSQSISELETDFKSYEEAELECLKKLIEIVKNK